MRSKVSINPEPIKATKLHDIISYYRDSKQLGDHMIKSQTSGQSYDFSTYDDVKPEDMDHPPIQNIDRLQANKASREPIVHRASDFYDVPEPSPAPEPAPASAPEPAPAPAE